MPCLTRYLPTTYTVQAQPALLVPILLSLRAVQTSALLSSLGFSRWWSFFRCRCPRMDLRISASLSSRPVASHPLVSGFHYPLPCPLDVGRYENPPRSSPAAALFASDEENPLSHRCRGCSQLLLLTLISPL